MIDGILAFGHGIAIPAVPTHERVISVFVGVLGAAHEQHVFLEWIGWVGGLNVHVWRKMVV